MQNQSREFQQAGQVRHIGGWQFELRDDEFADLKFEGKLVLRSVRAVVRDRDWNTADLVIDGLSKSSNENEGSVQFAVHSKGFGSEFSGTVRLEILGNQAIFSLDLESQSDYLTNRTGFIVLHSPSAAGSELLVRHASGDTEVSEFPVSVSPNQPVFDIAGLKWNQGATSIDVAFAGDVFEMEDQRNWTDASYKTYNRPLALPFPYAVAAGEHVVQSVTVLVESLGSVADEVSQLSKANRIELLPAGQFAQIQVAASTAPGENPSFDPIGDTVLVELDLESTNWRAALQRAAQTSRQLDVRAIVAAELNAAELASSLESLAEALQELPQLKVTRIALFDAGTHVASPEATDLLARLPYFIEQKPQILGGTRAHFTELNRNPQSILAGADAVAFSTTPFFHALGTEQLLEAVAMQRIIAKQAVRLAGGKPVHVGPIALRPRFNNVATGPQPTPALTDLSEGYGAAFTGSNDPRQTSPELVAWVIASAAALSVQGVASITYFEQWGPRGLADSTGKDHPVAEAVRVLAELAGQELFIGDSTDGFVWAIGAKSGDRLTILASNLNRFAVDFEVSLLGQTHQIKLGPLSWASVSS
jgi:hypothetical protein